MSRRKNLSAITCMALFVLILLAQGKEAFGREAALWEKYKKEFISGDGRVVDYMQGEVSHSEGQGYSMLLAVEYDDRKTFQKLLTWTMENLAVRNDRLLAWRWGKRLNGKWNVVDHNNATDGDILVALALVKAGEKWKDKGLTGQGVAMANSIHEHLIVEWKRRQLILPGYYGFGINGGFSLNPSYMIFPAFIVFGQADRKNSGAWAKIHADARYLVSHSSFGEMNLPADWVAADHNGRIRLHFEKSPYFGLDAVRVFLYMAFDDKPVFPAGLEKMLDLFDRLGYIPSRVNLETGEISLSPAPAGLYAVYAKAAAASGNDQTAKKLFSIARKNLDRETKNYYSMALYLLATIEEVL